jgi:hypothetical protein
MKLAQILTVSSLSLVLASTGCAVGSETHDLPTPQPAHELSAALNPPTVEASQQTEEVGTNVTDHLYDTNDHSDRIAYVNALHEVQKPLVH